ncbi:hypothetical protein CRYUN_Cryun15aG0052600 [Craigia yunnanensis]
MAHDWLDSTEPEDALKARPAKLVKDTEMTALVQQQYFIPLVEATSIVSGPGLPVLFLIFYLHLTLRSMDDTVLTSGGLRDLLGEIEVNGVTFSEVTWLEEFQPPDNFVIRRGLYKGPVIRT